MSKDEFKDRLFDVLNDTDDIPIEDIETDHQNNSFEIKTVKTYYFIKLLYYKIKLITYQYSKFSLLFNRIILVFMVAYLDFVLSRLQNYRTEVLIILHYSSNLNL